jgi:hypothetical protein
MDYLDGRFTTDALYGLASVVVFSHVFPHVAPATMISHGLCHYHSKYICIQTCSPKDMAAWLPIADVSIGRCQLTPGPRRGS